VQPPPAPSATGPEARLAAAVRGLRGEEEIPPSVRTALPEDPPELIVELTPEDDGEAGFPPRVEAILDGLERIGNETTTPELARLSRFTAAMVGILVKKRLVTEDELASAFMKAERRAKQR
jgi:hypothetical protein